MSEQQQVVLVKTKSSAPMLLGVIAFILSIPGTLCNLICAGVVADASGGNTAPFLILVPVFANFILCFFCKAKFSAVTGGIMVLLSILASIVNVITFSLLSLIASILFLVAGALSIANAKRPAA